MNLSNIRRIEELEVKGRKVLVRADLNCPTDSSGRLTDTLKLERAASTLKHLLERDARVIVIGHLGHAGEKEARSLEPCGAYFAEKLGIEIFLPEELQGPMPTKLIAELADDKLVLLPNLLNDEREAAGDENLARYFAGLCEIFTADCLEGPADYASLGKLARFSPVRGIGLAAEAEVEAANRVQQALGDPTAIVVGGRFQEGLPLLEALVGKRRTFCLGGLAATTLLAATGQDLKATKVDRSLLAQARSWLEKAQAAGCTVLLPTDVEVQNQAAQARTTSVKSLQADERIRDVGPETVSQFLQAARTASQVVVFGGMGTRPAYTTATTTLLNGLSDSGPPTVLINEPSLPIQRLLESEKCAKFAFVSAAPEAFVRLLQGQTLAAVECLRLAG